MNLIFKKRFLLLDPSKLIFHGENLIYSSNPICLVINQSKFRLFFNSRDTENRSSVYSIDVTYPEFLPKYESIKLQMGFGRSSEYFSHGISLGQIFEVNGSKFVSIMGWKNDPIKHWEGRIGYIPLNKSGDLTTLSDKPWINLDESDPISLSYPAVISEGGFLRVWYGSTITWDAGNGEMLHVIKEGLINLEGDLTKTEITVPYVLGEAQAFSRPAVLEINGKKLLAYSFRGNVTKYQIGFMWLNDFSTASQLNGIKSFKPSENSLENEMVEYPSFLTIGSNIYMLYNGNEFGKSGVGVALLEIKK